MTASDSIYVKLARDTIEKFVCREKIEISKQTLSEELQQQAGVFVSIKKNGQLRGCIGTIEPMKDNLAEEITANAISAASRDPRFPAIKEDELPELDISVDVLEKPEAVDSMAELDPFKYGVIVEKGFSRGVLLPNLEGIDTVEKQVEIAVSKAGLRPEDITGVQLYRFRVNRYK